MISTSLPFLRKTFISLSRALIRKELFAGSFPLPGVVSQSDPGFHCVISSISSSACSQQQTSVNPHFGPGIRDVAVGDIIIHIDVQLGVNCFLAVPLL